MTQDLQTDTHSGACGCSACNVNEADMAKLEEGFAAAPSKQAGGFAAKLDAEQPDVADLALR